MGVARKLVSRVFARSVPGEGMEKKIPRLASPVGEKDRWTVRMLAVVVVVVVVATAVLLALSLSLWFGAAVDLASLEEFATKVRVPINVNNSHTHTQRERKRETHTHTPPPPTETNLATHGCKGLCFLHDPRDLAGTYTCA